MSVKFNTHVIDVEELLCFPESKGFIIVYTYRPSQCAKLECILHFFDRVSEETSKLTGNVTFTRQVTLETRSQ